MRPKILAYYFPSWHHDKRNTEWFGSHWDEWTLVEAARPRFEGHRQPRVPLDGRFDEATPEEAEKQIALAREFGVDGFLVDYYWYDDGPYLSRGLDKGLLKASNSGDVEIAIMWANHELVDIFPFEPGGSGDAALLKSGAIGLEAFQAMAHHVIESYFPLSNYLRVDGKPWFSIYEIGNLVAGLGSVEAARSALEWFEAETIAAGFPGLHLDALIWGVAVLPAAVVLDDPQSLLEDLSISSATSYVWVHHTQTTEHDFPAASVERLQEDAFAEYESYAESLDIPFYPNVTVGWDSTPRLGDGVSFESGPYPRFPVWDQNPEQFKAGLSRAKAFLEDHPTDSPIVTVNAWNEWTEGSYLLPDTTHGTAFLEAIRDVFPPESAQLTTGEGAN